jgi:hypothetical protein
MVLFLFLSGGFQSDYYCHQYSQTKIIFISGLLVLFGLQLQYTLVFLRKKEGSSISIKHNKHLLISPYFVYDGT